MTNKESQNFYSRLQSFLSQMAEIPPLEWAYFISQVRISRIAKGEMLFTQGVKSHLVGFVVKGLVHTFYTGADGKERTKNFAWEGRLISPWVAIIQNQEASFSAQALEDTYVVNIDGRKMREITNRHSCWERVMRKCNESLLIEREKREYQVLMMSSLERYESFCTDYQAIISRIPQYLIASYLGITPVALSRLLSQQDEGAATQAIIK